MSNDPIFDAPGPKDVQPTPFRPAYVKRRRLEPGELLAAGGVAAGIAAAAFYLATIWLERTPLLAADDDGPPPGVRPRTRR